MKHLFTLILNLSFFAGCCGVVYGLWLLAEPAAWIGGGLLAAVFSGVVYHQNTKGVET